MIAPRVSGDISRTMESALEKSLSRPRILESMRYKDPASAAKPLWLNEFRAWGTVNGTTVPTNTALTWFDEGTPSAVFTVEDVIYTADVHTYITVKGP